MRNKTINKIADTIIHTQRSQYHAGYEQGMKDATAQAQAHFNDLFLASALHEAMLAMGFEVADENTTWDIGDTMVIGNVTYTYIGAGGWQDGLKATYYYNSNPRQMTFLYV